MKYLVLMLLTVVLSHADAFQELQKSCDNKEPKVCNDLGKKYYHGQGVRKNPSQGLVFFEKGCERGYAESCYNLGAMYERGETGGSSRYHKARKYFQQACDGGEGEACHALGLMYAYGKVVRADRAKAVDYFGKACDLNWSESCTIHKRMSKK